MDIVTVFIFVASFFGLYGAMVVLGWMVDKLLRRVFGKGIVPKGYWS